MLQYLAMSWCGGDCGRPQAIPRGTRARGRPFVDCQRRTGEVSLSNGIGVESEWNPRGPPAEVTKSRADPSGPKGPSGDERGRCCSPGGRRPQRAYDRQAPSNDRRSKDQRKSGGALRSAAGDGRAARSGSWRSDVKPRRGSGGASSQGRAERRTRRRRKASKPMWSRPQTAWRKRPRQWYGCRRGKTSEGQGVDEERGLYSKGNTKRETRRTPWSEAGCNKPAHSSAEKPVRVVKNHGGGTSHTGGTCGPRRTERGAGVDAREHDDGGAH